MSDLSPKSIISGVILRNGTDFNISHYACVGDSIWAKLLFHQWRVTGPVWPVAPDNMRYFHLNQRDEALRWLR